MISHITPLISGHTVPLDDIPFTQHSLCDAICPSLWITNTSPFLIFAACSHWRRQIFGEFSDLKCAQPTLLLLPWYSPFGTITQAADQCCWREHLVGLHGPIGTEKKKTSVATIHSSSTVLEQWSRDEHVLRSKRNISRRRSENKKGTEKQ